MLKWQGLISRGTLYFICAIIASFSACIVLLGITSDVEFAQAKINTSGVRKEGGLSIVIVGDTMLDRLVRFRMESEGHDYPFRTITPFIISHDIGVSNLEGVYTSNPSVTLTDMSKLQFTFNPEGARFLKEAGFGIVSQANNHTNDFGRDGLFESRGVLTSNEIQNFGDYFNETRSLSFIKKGQKVAFVGFNQFSGSNADGVLQDVRALSTSGYFVIVFPHWGEEYQREPTAGQRELAHQWIDQGADLVIGAHPHVIEPLEEYQGKIIVYSLGNFVFDQSFSKETQLGLAASIDLVDSGYSLRLTPLSLARSQPTVLKGDEANKILEALANDSVGSNTLKDQIRSGVIEMKR